MLRLFFIIVACAIAFALCDDSTDIQEESPMKGQRFGSDGVEVPYPSTDQAWNRDIRSPSYQDMMSRSLRSYDDMFSRSQRSETSYDEMMSRSLRSMALADMMSRTLRSKSFNDMMSRTLRSDYNDMLSRSLRSMAYSDMMSRSLRFSQ